jgi:signal transduction histidine kinase
VLTETYRHYAAELRLVGSASRRLLDKLSNQESRDVFSEESKTEMRRISSDSSPFGRFRSLQSRPAASLDPSPISRRDRQSFPAERPIGNLAEELRANLNLVSALAGPGITVGLTVAGGNHPIAMTGDDLTRVLVNLARNSTDAMPHGGHIQVALEERPGHLSLSFTDNGPGIPDAALEAIFSPGFSTHVRLGPAAETGAWPVQHRGLGLSIVRSIVSAARGAVWAANRIDLDGRPAESAAKSLAESSAERRDDSPKGRSDLDGSALESPQPPSPKPAGDTHETSGVALGKPPENTLETIIAVTGAVISLEFPIEESSRIP